MLCSVNRLAWAGGQLTACIVCCSSSTRMMGGRRVVSNALRLARFT